MDPLSMEWIRAKVENSEFLLSHHAHEERQAEDRHFCPTPRKPTIRIFLLSLLI